MMLDLMHQSSNQPCTTVFFLFDCSMKSILGSIFPLSAACCPALAPRWWWSSCWTCQAFLRITFGGRRGDEWFFWYRISWVLVFTTFSRLSTGTELWRMIALDRVCQNVNPLSWKLSTWFWYTFQYTAFWYSFHLVLQGTCRGVVTS